jgi:hypothetical protein
MSDSNYVNSLIAIVNTVNDSPITNPNAPKIFLTYELAATGRTRISREVFNLWDNSSDDLRVEIFDFLPCRTGESDRVITH